MVWIIERRYGQQSRWYARGDTFFFSRKEARARIVELRERLSGWNRSATVTAMVHYRPVKYVSTMSPR